MDDYSNIIRDAIQAMRADSDHRWHAVADLLAGGPLSYAGLIDRNPRKCPSDYPDAERGVNVACAYLNR